MSWPRFSLGRWRTGIAVALARFPLVILCGVVAAACGIVANHWHENEAIVGQCERLALTALLGIPLLFGLRILRERTPRLRFIAESLGSVILVAWFLAHSARPNDEPLIVFIRWALVFAALNFFASLSPYLRRAPELGFWQWNFYLGFRFCLTTLYAAILTGGLEIALWSADQLFELHLNHAFLDLWLCLAGVFWPIFFLSDAPADFAVLETNLDYPRWLKIFTQSALAPLIFVYAAILYTYAIKIIAQRAWPHGWVALPVLILSAVGIFAALLLHPLQDLPNEKWARIFLRIFPPALGPLAVLLFMAVHKRIADYGVTEDRYLGILASVCIFIWSLVFTFRRQADVRWISAASAILCLTSAYGPWSAGAVSQRSQLHRLGEILQEHHLWSGNAAQAAAAPLNLSAQDNERLRSSLVYLLRMHGSDSLRPFFAKVLDPAKLNSANDASGIIDALHIATKTPVRSLSSSPDSKMSHRDQTTALPIDGYRRLWQVALLGGDSGKWMPKQFGNVSIGQTDGKIEVVGVGETTPQILPLPQALITAVENGSELQVEASTIDFKTGQHSYRLVFDNVQLKNWPSGPRISNCTFVLLEK